MWHFLHISQKHFLEAHFGLDWRVVSVFNSWFCIDYGDIYAIDSSFVCAITATPVWEPQLIDQLNLIMCVCVCARESERARRGDQKCLYKHRINYLSVIHSIGSKYIFISEMFPFNLSYRFQYTILIPMFVGGNDNHVLLYQ